MKILLINVPSPHAYHSKSIKFQITSVYPPIGLLYIASTLEKKGHDIEIIDTYFEKNIKEKIRKSLSSVDVVGITVYTVTCEKIKELTAYIKEIKPEIPIIIGGPHCMFNSDTALIDLPDADICVDGEGELIIDDVMRALNGEKKITEIAGIHYRKNNEIKNGKPSLLIHDLDSIPFPARHLVYKYDYGQDIGPFKYRPKLTTILTSRGCPFKCRFCTRKITSMENFRMRSAENVIKEIQEISKNYNSIYIADDNFLSDKKRVYKITDFIIDEALDLDVLILGARVDSAEPELYNKLKKAGVKFMEFGIESGNQDVLDFYKKRITLDQIRQAVKLSNKMGFFTSGNFILGAPIETNKHIHQTIKFACSLPLDKASFRPLCYQRGSDLWDEAVKNGKISSDTQLVVADSSLELGNFTSEELEKFCTQAIKRFYFRPNYLAKQIYGSFIEKITS